MELVLVENPSLTELAKLAAQEVREEDAQEEDQRVEGLLGRLKEINSEFDGVDKEIKGLSKNQRKKVLATLDGNMSALKAEKTGILDDEAIQLIHIKKLTEEVPKSKSWDELNNIVEASISRGWFEEPSRNKRGNVNFGTLRFSNHKNPELKQAMANLKKVILAKVSKEVKSRKKGNQK